MTCTTTHDTKRSQDVRARINVLCEVPHLWRKAVNQWSRLNRRFHREVEGQRAPSHADEWLFYQTLVGMWPTTPPALEDFETLIHRLQGYMEKATREAKSRTSWINPNVAYDDSIREFVASVLDPKKNKKFLGEFQSFLDRVLDWGMYTALSQLVVKLMSPGVPDIYQGQEAWDFSLVDPDNRRPVDYDCRRERLDEINRRWGSSAEGRVELARELAKSPRDPRLKQFVTSRLLRLRRDEGSLFSEGTYVPLEVVGAASKHLCAFAWTRETSEGCRGAIVAAPRLIAGLTSGETEGASPRPFLDSAIWGDTRLRVDGLPQGIWKHCFTDVQVQLSGGELAVADLLAAIPALVLTFCP